MCLPVDRTYSATAGDWSCNEPASVAAVLPSADTASAPKSDAPKADAMAPAKIAIVDIEKAIKQTSAGQKMSKELQTEFEKKKTEFTKRDGDLRKMFEDLEKKKSLLTDEARQKKAMELQQEQMKFQKEVGFHNGARVFEIFSFFLKMAPYIQMSNIGSINRHTSFIYKNGKINYACVVHTEILVLHAFF